MLMRGSRRWHLVPPRPPAGPAAEPAREASGNVRSVLDEEDAAELPNKQHLESEQEETLMMGVSGRG